MKRGCSHSKAEKRDASPDIFGYCRHRCFTFYVGLLVLLLLLLIQLFLTPSFSFCLFVVPTIFRLAIE